MSGDFVRVLFYGKNDRVDNGCRCNECTGDVVTTDDDERRTTLLSS